MASPDAIADGIKTNRQARAVMGLVAEMLRRGYELVPTISADFAEIFTGSIDELRAQANSALDLDNARAQGIYQLLPDNDDVMEEKHRPRIQLAIEQAQDDISSISKAAAEIAVDYTDEMASIVVPIVKRIVDKVAELPKQLSKGILASIWPLLLVAGIVLIIMFRVRKASPI